MKQSPKQDFDFDRPDKRMPYTVPDGFFADLESKILAATVGADNKADTPTNTQTGTTTDTTTAKRGRTLQPGAFHPDTLHASTPRHRMLGTGTLRRGTPRRRMLGTGTLRRWFIAGAAAAALAAVVLLPRRSDPQPVTIAEVEQVFTQLTDEDQAELLALYRNDPFLDL